MSTNLSLQTTQLSEKLEFLHNFKLGGEKLVMLIGILYSTVTMNKSGVCQSMTHKVI